MIYRYIIEESLIPTMEGGSLDNLRKASSSFRLLQMVVFPVGLLRAYNGQRHESRVVVASDS